MVVGVNGAGKTTTIGKLAYQLKKQGLKVVLGAADTFRAAAIDQLTSLGRSSGRSNHKTIYGQRPCIRCFDTFKVQ